MANEKPTNVSAYTINAATGALTAISGSLFAGVSGPSSVTTTAGPAISTTATLVSLQTIPANLTIVNSGLGATQQYLAVGTYSDGSTQFLTASVTWSSAAAAVATISNSAGSSGLATTTGFGTATITVTLGAISATTSLTVSAPPPVSIAVTPASPTITAGTALQFTATGTYSDGSTQNLSSTVTWMSSNTGVATISSTGLATGVARGQHYDHRHHEGTQIFEL